MKARWFVGILALMVVMAFAAVGCATLQGEPKPGADRGHDAEVAEPARKISPLRPHDLRHTFAYRLAAETDNDAYELERRLGHGSQRYTNPPEDVAAGYLEEL